MHECRVAIADEVGRQDHRSQVAAERKGARALGARHARRLFATAETFGADEARRIGLLHEVANATALDTAVDRQVDLLLKAGPVAAASAKALVRRVVASEGDVDAANADLIARLRVSPEGQEGIQAFLDKRKPAWTAA